MGRRVLLDHQFRVPFMGLWTAFRSNSEVVIQHAEQLFGQWRRLDERLIKRGPGLTVNMVVHPNNVTDFGAIPLLYRSHSPYLIASRSADMLLLDSDRGVAAGYVTPDTASNADGVLRQILRSVALNIALGHDRSPIHAAGVVGRRRTLLLAGPSGTGKSTLCYACVREGMGLLAEDAVFVSIDGGLRLWQCLPDIHLAQELVAQFPELRGLAHSPLKGSEPEVRVETGDWDSSRSCLSADDATLCVLQRTGGDDTRVEPIEQAAALEALLANPEPGFDLSRRARDVAETLARRGACRVLMGHDLGRAVAVLRSLADA